jgi:hypothetical protein
MALNQRIIQIWKKEFVEKYGNALVKDIYMNMRRERIKTAEAFKPGYKERMRIFPLSIRNNRGLSDTEDKVKSEMLRSMISFISSDLIY